MPFKNNNFVDDYDILWEHEILPRKNYLLLHMNEATTAVYRFILDLTIICPILIIDNLQATTVITPLLVGKLKRKNRR